MTDGPFNLSQLCTDVASIWRAAGAQPLDPIEAMLELLAIRRRGSVPAGLVEHDELTLRSWERLRDELAHEIDLPRPDSNLGRIVDTAPGLLEHTRRAVARISQVASAPTAQDYVPALLNFLIHTPQSGLRQTPFGYFTWPEYLPSLFASLLGKPASEPVYCPYESSSWMPLLLAHAGWPVVCELRDPQAARILLLFAFLGGWKVKAHVSDPIRRPSWLDGDALHQFKFAAGITSFGLRLRDEPYQDHYGRFPVRFHHGEAIQLAHLIAQTSGRVLVIVPEGFLFRTSGGERDYKEHLIRRGMLSVVIRLPRDALAAYANVQSSLLIFETEGTKDRNVLFVDASDELGRKSRRREKDGDTRNAVEQIVSIIHARGETRISAIAAYDEIAAQEFNISVDRYVRSEEEQKIANALDEAKTVELKDIAEIIRPQAVPTEESEHAQTFVEVSLQDVQPDGSIRQPTKSIQIEDRSLGKVMRQKLEPGDILLSVRGRIGTVGIVAEVRGEDGPIDWLASQAFAILRLRNNSPIKPLILYRYLASPLGQGLLQSLSTGATVPMISMGDVKKLRIMIPSAAEQREIERQYDKMLKLRSQISQLEKSASELNATSWPMTKIFAIN